jgi:predicted dehydrogenase
VGQGEPVGENNLAASFRFHDGSVANLTYCTMGSRTSGGERVEVFSQGLGVATEDFKSLTVAGGRRSVRRRWFSEKGYKEQLQAFLEAVRRGNTPSVTVRDGARATLVCLKMLESARHGKPCAIDLGEVGLG